jgi:hypothetical protein
VVAGTRLRCIVLEVNGRTLLIHVEAPQDVFESILSDVDEVLGSIEVLAATP